MPCALRSRRRPTRPARPCRAGRSCRGRRSRRSRHHGAPPPGADGFPYEVTRTDGEWRAGLIEAEFRVLRLRDTELPETSPNWNRDEPGRYACRGRDLALHRSERKRDVGIGWAFFQLGGRNATLVGIGAFGGMTEGAPLDVIEAHCRRCGARIWATSCRSRGSCCTASTARPSASSRRRRERAGPTGEARIAARGGLGLRSA